jgi:hypothetical protein
VKDKQLATFRVPVVSTWRSAESATAPLPPAGIGVHPAAADAMMAAAHIVATWRTVRVLVNLIGYSS